MNVPIGLVAIPLALRVLERDHRLEAARRIDALGTVLATAGLLGVYSISQIPVAGWNVVAVGGLAGSIVLLIGFVLRQRTAAVPLIPPALFATRRFSAANAVLLTMTMAGMGLQFLTALYLQDVLRFGPLQTGLGFLAVTVSIAVASLGGSGRLADRFGPEPVLVAGLVLFTTGMLLLARAPGDGTYAADVAPAMIMMGLGFGLAMPQVTVIAMQGADPALVSSASGVVNTTQQVGGAVGLSLAASVAASTTAGLLAAGEEPVAAQATGLRFGYAVAAGALVVGTVLAVLLAVGRARGRMAAPNSSPARTDPTPDHPHANVRARSD